MAVREEAVSSALCSPSVVESVIEDMKRSGLGVEHHCMMPGFMSR